jgi:phospholipid/cholesterol/gamma-HCH transport system substrate-binding protein
MPSQVKVRWAQLRVGVMAMVSMAILAVLIFLFTQDKPIWEHYDTIYTFMDDSAALAKGAPVRLNGILIGSVTNIGLSGSRDPNRIVRVTMEVAAFRLKNIPIDSVAGIDAENVLGTKFINITMGKSRVTVEPQGEVKSEASPEIQDLVKKGFGLFDAAQAILVRLDKIVGLIESGQGSIGKFLVDEEFYDRLVKTVAELQKVSETIGGGKGTVGRLLYDESLYNEAHTTVQRLDQVIQDLQAGQGTAGQLLKNPELYKDAQASIAQVRQLLDDLNAGKGTAGKLLKDEVAYKQIQSILGQVDTTLGRINAGQGTVGQLLANPQLYDSMRGLSTELQGLVGDVRKNPKKFLRVKFSIF